jgi:DNA primase
MPATMGTFRTVTSDGEEKRDSSVEDARGSPALAQLGGVEFPSWGALAAD